MQLAREDIVAAILTLVLACDWVNILDWQVLVKILGVELVLGRLASFVKVDNGRNVIVLCRRICVINGLNCV